MCMWCVAAVPRQYQPDIIMLLPKLLEPADHATAANLLIAHLAEATRLGAAAEALIRLPVLATLGLLTVDAGTAKKLLAAVLNVCCFVLTASCFLQLLQLTVLLYCYLCHAYIHGVQSLFGDSLALLVQSIQAQLCAKSTSLCPCSTSLDSSVYLVADS